ncbi:MAG: tetratricopeptide repeat protein [Candidatus Zixiibacteriota bacterium]
MTRSLDDRIARGEELFGAGDLDNAEKLFRETLADNPANPSALNNLAVICHTRGALAEACGILALSLELDSSNADALSNLQSLLNEIGHTKTLATSILAWPRLVSRLIEGKMDAVDCQLLRKLSASLSDSQKDFALRHLAQHNGNSDLILLILSTLSAINRAIALSLDEWISRSNQPRAIRDIVEEMILNKTSDLTIITEIAHRGSPRVHDERNKLGYEFGPRRVTSAFSGDDPFMKHVPANAPSKKDGMRVLLIADYNIVGQMTAIMRALNLYTNHCARCVIFQEDYLSYDHDVVVRNESGEVSEQALEETRQLISRADFFHIGRQLLPLTGIDWNRWISPRNAVFQYFGSEIRNNPKEMLDFHNRTGFTAITACDWTMYKAVKSSFYHIQPYMMEVNDLPQAAMDFSSGVRVCHAPSNQNYRNLKRSETILETVNCLRADIPNLESVLIEGKKNSECLEMKSRCHMHIVSLLVTFGFNAIESAAMGLVPVVQLDNFTRLLYPDAPVVHATENTLYDAVRTLLKDQARMNETGQACRDWARREFDSRTMVQKYWYLYDLIYNGQSVTYPELFK